jgi:hypothetical protein
MAAGPFRIGLGGWTVKSMEEKPPDFGPGAAQILGMWERLLSRKEGVRKAIARYAAKQCPRIQELLILASFRKLLEMLEPPLPAGIPMNATNIQKFWIDHPNELNNITDVHADIVSYLRTAEEIEMIQNQSKIRMLETIKNDQLTILALYPVMEDLYAKKPGRPITRRLVAVRGLQMQIDNKQIDNKWTLKRTAREVCDCGKATHDGYCERQLHQTIIKLRKLLGECGIECPKP